MDERHERSRKTSRQRRRARLSIQLLLLLPAAGAGIAVSGCARDDGRGKRVVLYYFHPGVRCERCVQLEKATRGIVESTYAAELAEGTLEWQSVDTDDHGSRRLVRRLKPSGTALFVCRIEGGRIGRHEELRDASKYLRNQELLTSYIQTNVSRYLEEAQ